MAVRGSCFGSMQLLFSYFSFAFIAPSLLPNPSCFLQSGWVLFLCLCSELKVIGFWVKPFESLQCCKGILFCLNLWTSFVLSAVVCPLGGVKVTLLDPSPFQSSLCFDMSTGSIDHMGLIQNHLAFQVHKIEISNYTAQKCCFQKLQLYVMSRLSQQFHPNSMITLQILQRSILSQPCYAAPVTQQA